MEIIPREDCMGCHACFNICPTNAITMVTDEKGFKTYEIDQEKCIKCGQCKKVCPVLNNKQIVNEPRAYACINKNLDERIQSSSGGIFSLLAKNILDRGGVVFGAQFDDNWNVIHGYIERYEDINKLRSSKYVQSTIGTTYKEVKQFLDNERFVLFTGTPCQIEGLKSFLGKEYNKLITQDIICHGVPSPKVWEKYKEYRYKKDKSLPKKISFRNKDEGWKSFNMKFDYKQYSYKNNQQKDLFMQSFLRNTILRGSCYNCHFKKKNRISDVTLADFWGVNKILPNFDDDKGTSLVIINSKKGEELFDKIKSKINYKEVNLNEAIKYNPSMIKSAKVDVKRKEFFENIDKYDFRKLVNKFTSRPAINKLIINKLKRILKEVLILKNK